MLIAAQYSGAAVKVQENFVFGETNTAKDFLAKFPTGKVRLNKAIIQYILWERVYLVSIPYKFG